MLKVGFFFIFLFFQGSLFASDIAVLTAAIGSGYQEAVKIAMENKRRYCEKHGYDFILLQESLDTTRYPAWSKIKLCEKILKEGQYKWVFWTDADSLVMNFSVRLEELIDDDYNFIACFADDNVNGTHVNTGQFFLKNCPLSLAFIEDAYRQTQFLNHCWWEQAAVIHLLKTNQVYAESSKIVTTRLFNSLHDGLRPELIQTYQTGDFILHFAGYPIGKVQAELSRYENDVVDSKAMWDLDYYLGLYGIESSARKNIQSKNDYTKIEDREFFQSLQSLKRIDKILGIGFGSGRMTETVFLSFPSGKISCIDQCFNDYAPICIEFFDRKYPQQFHFVQSSIEEFLLDLKSKNSKEIDLVYISNDHSYEISRDTILHIQEVVKERAYILINASSIETIKVINDCVDLKVLEIVRKDPSTIESIDAADNWILVRFMPMT